MTLDEANKVAAVIAEADSGCVSCAADLARRMTAVFPDYVWQVVYDDQGVYDTVRACPSPTGE